MGGVTGRATSRSHSQWAFFNKRGRLSPSQQAYTLEVLSCVLDNFYTSLPLLGRIRHDFKIGACGAARQNSVGFPVELKIPKQDFNKHAYHSLKTMILKDPHFNEEVGAQTWIVNAPVAIMSTVHQLGTMMDRVGKRPGKRSTNAKKAREAFGGAYEKEMPIPLYIEDYNRHIGDVDIVDQLRSYYETQLTSFRTWWPMLF